MNCVDILLFANLFYKLDGIFVKFKHRPRVYYFKVLKDACYIFKHLAVQPEIFFFIFTAVTVIVAECAFGINTPTATQKDNFTTVFFVNYTVPFHKFGIKKHPQGVYGHSKSYAFPP